MYHDDARKLDAAKPASADITRAEIEASLEALLADPAFQVSERNRRFLRFVVERTLDGNTDEIRAYGIATKVFGRPPNFDAAVDPIVRIEATRLRSALYHYYDSRHAPAGIQISLPKGGYVPAFERHTRISVAVEPPQPFLGAASPSDRRSWPSLSHKALLLIGGAAALLIAAIAMLSGRLFSPAAEFLERPLLIVETTAAPGVNSDAGLVQDTLVTSLMRFDRWEVANRNSPIPDVPAGLLRHDYLLRLNLRPEPTGDALWWQLFDNETGQLLRSDVIHPIDTAEKQDLSGSVFRLADWIGGSRGLVNSIEMSRFGENVPLGYGCIAWMEAEIWLWDRQRLANVRDCLERSLRAYPEDPDYMAALARVLMRGEKFDGPQPQSKEALELALRAVQLSPYSSQAAWALAIAYYRAGNIAFAADVARGAMQLNPNDLSLRSLAGIAIFQNGNFEEGAQLVRSAEDSRTSLSAESYMLLALDAYRRGDNDDVIKRTEPGGGNQICFCSIAIRAVAFYDTGRSAQAKDELANLLKLRPTVAEDFSQAMASRGMSAEITARLKADLSRIGFKVN